LRKNFLLAHADDCAKIAVFSPLASHRCTPRGAIRGEIISNQGSECELSLDQAVVRVQASQREWQKLVR
jgi:hypothetical protein